MTRYSYQTRLLARGSLSLEQVKIQLSDGPLLDAELAVGHAHRAAILVRESDNLYWHAWTRRDALQDALGPDEELNALLRPQAW